MKITNNPPLTPLQQMEQGKGASVKESGAKGGTPASSTSGSVAHLSQRLNDSSQDIDTVKIDQIRQAIADGKLEINSEKIADRLIESLRDIKPHDPKNPV
ncbi:MAG: flagellar biosynthesis anti-sigma factor FlgM [Gammaproteobacteria bacterium]|nr:MAG: flagellar biosynthesis anti-sigma factor FlgM [Gammaproteobacteria bacterium]